MDKRPAGIMGSRFFFPEGAPGYTKRQSVFFIGKKSAVYGVRAGAPRGTATLPL